MHNANLNTRTVALLLGAAVIIAVLVVVLQLPSLSVRKLLHGERVVASGQFWLLEVLAGCITSFIITGVAVLLFRRLMGWVSAISVVMQLAWMAVTLEFATRAGSIAEVGFRSAEPVGIVVGAALAVLVVRGVFRDKQEAKP